MDKKKKIILVSIISVVSLAMIIGFGISSNTKNESGDKVLANSNADEPVEEEVEPEKESSEEAPVEESQNNESGDSEVTVENTPASIDDDPVNQPPPAEPNGVNLTDFEKKLKELGYSYFEDKCYDLFEDETSIAFVEIQDSGVKFTLKNKEKISHDAIKGAIVSLLPNESQELFNIINGSTTELAISLDNRTASIEVKDGELYLFISN